MASLENNGKVLKNISLQVPKSVMGWPWIWRKRVLHLKSNRWALTLVIHPWIQPINNSSNEITTPTFFTHPLLPLFHYFFKVMNSTQSNYYYYYRQSAELFFFLSLSTLSWPVCQNGSFSSVYVFSSLLFGFPFFLLRTVWQESHMLVSGGRFFLAFAPLFKWTHSKND